MKVTKHKGLFDRWKNLSWDVNHAAGLVQNDMEIDENDLLIHIAEARRLIQKLETLVRDTNNYLIHNVEPK